MNCVFVACNKNNNKKCTVHTLQCCIHIPSVIHTLMISPQFRVLEMTEWRGDRFAQQHSLMKDQWGPKQVRVLSMKTLDSTHFVGVIYNTFCAMFAFKFSARMDRGSFC
jgi:hypothetical protein